MNQKNNILGNLKMDEVFEIEAVEQPKPKPVKAKRAVSEERKKQLIEQLRKAREMRKNGGKPIEQPKIKDIEEPVEPVEQPKKRQTKKVENDNTEEQKETYLKSLVYKTDKSTNKTARPTRKPIVKKDVEVEPIVKKQEEPKEQPKVKEEPKPKQEIPTTPIITIQQPIAPTPIVKYTFKKPKWG